MCAAPVTSCSPKHPTIETAAIFSASERRALFQNSPSSDWQSTGYVPIQVIFTICRRPHGKFHLQHPPIPSSTQAKWVSGYWRTENCWTYTERHLLGLDRTLVITVKWNYLISSQNAPSATWHSLLIVCIQLMQRLEAAGVLTSGRTELPELHQINLTAFLILCAETFACVWSVFREWINRSPTFSPSLQGCNDAWNDQIKPL